MCLLESRVLSSSLDGVEETNNVRVGRKVLMPRREGLETKEQEVPEIEIDR